MSESDLTQLTDSLDQIEPGFLPKPLFNSVARLVKLSAVEFIPFRKTPDGRVEVLLTRRDSDDMFWANMLHTPGTIIRQTDTSLEDAFERLFAEELQLTAPIAPIFVGVNILPYKRASAITIEYFLEYTGDSPVGHFYDVENLPEETIPEQLPMIKRALDAFMKS